MKVLINLAVLPCVVLIILYASKPLNGQLYINRLSIRFPVPTAQDLDRGYVESHLSLGQSDLSIQTSVPGMTAWKLYITTEQPFFTPANLNKPHNDILWKLRDESESKYRPVGLQRTLVSTGRSTRNIELDFRLVLEWTDPPAEYIAEILFSLETTKMRKYRKDKKIKTLPTDKSLY